jgi:hypothetical protein
MTIAELYNKLANKDFQDYQTAKLTWPVFMYGYDSKNEYQIRKDILDIKERLHRPNNYLNVLTMDIFQVFLNFLEVSNFGKKNKLQFYLESETDKPDKVQQALIKDAASKKFFDYVHERITHHLESSSEFEVAYVFIYGFGAMFPCLRTNKFLNNYEKYIGEFPYKMIVFYPGKVKPSYNLFGLVNDENLYRATTLIND